ncbi:NAD-dependent protein deacylase [Paenibacillus sp. CAA11]|uniref:NAD-dependent protein deacylase n=1 Tax=Paenibacillus sp. CAA11 TaxID=1532905 RepID=UPI000D38BDFE|nr:NAD-dependent protein deacylase [Paenibacillus sp. CAA11]AWB45656.1 NAD-dependent protein deacylase [Paenibacillus sp. CAA11]
MEAKLEQLAKWISESNRIAFFGGAGISTESGIPDFRSAAGIYQMENQSPYSPETILSRSFFDRHPEVFFDFYRSKMLHPEAKPNAAHRFLAELERRNKLIGVVTQNIDGLHQAAGNKHVFELHGTVQRNTCMECGAPYSLEHILSIEEAVPHCSKCGGVIKPDVVLYEEPLDQHTIEQALAVIEGADLLLIGGTSLTVQPAAHFVTYFRGNYTVLLNASRTAYDHRANLIITEPIGQAFEKVGKILYSDNR